MRQTNETGRTLLEMLMVMSLLSLMVISTVGGIQYGAGVYRAGVITTEVDDVARQTMRLMAFFGGDVSVADRQLTAVNFCASNILQRACTPVDQVASYPAGWSNGEIKVNLTMGQPVTITVTNIPAVICGKMREYKWKNAYIMEENCAAMVFGLALNAGGGGSIGLSPTYHAWA